MKRFAWPMRIASSVASASRGRSALKGGADVLKLSGRSDNELAAAWANETQEASAFDQHGHQCFSVSSRWGRKQLNQQMHRDVKRLHASLPGNLQAQGLQNLSQDESQPQLDQDDFLFGSPPQGDADLAFEGQEGQFDVPSTCVKLGNLQHGQLCWVQHIGQIAVRFASQLVLHQTNRVGCSIGPIGTQPDECIQDPMGFILIEDLLHGVTGALLQARNPEEALPSQVIKPGETEIAQVSHNEAAVSQTFQEFQDAHIAASRNVSTKLQAHPLLQTQVQESGQFAWSQMRVFVWHFHQIISEPFEFIEGGFIKSHHLWGKAGQGQSRHLLFDQKSLQVARDLLKEPLQRLGSSSKQARAHRFIGDREDGKGADWSQDHRAPDPTQTISLTQDAYQQSQPQMQQAKRCRTTTTTLGRDGRLCARKREHLVQKADHLLLQWESRRQRLQACSIMRHKGNSLFLFHQEKQLIFERIFPHFSRFGKPTGLPHSLSRDFHSFFTSPLVFYENEPSSNQYADSIFDLLVADG